MKTVALIAHDQKKQQMLDFVREHLSLLSPHSLLATATTGRRLRDELNLNVHTYLSGPLGGDQQIGARIAAGEVDLVIFLRDPLMFAGAGPRKAVERDGARVHAIQ